MTYIENQPTSVKAIACLRRSVGWNGMEESYNNPLMTSYYHIACYDGGKLVGYVDTVSNGATDAYIQDLMVDPEYQSQGIRHRADEPYNSTAEREKNFHDFRAV